MKKYILSVVVCMLVTGLVLSGCSKKNDDSAALALGYDMTQYYGKNWENVTAEVQKLSQYNAEASVPESGIELYVINDSIDNLDFLAYPSYTDSESGRICGGYHKVARGTELSDQDIQAMNGIYSALVEQYGEPKWNNGATHIACPDTNGEDIWSESELPQSLQDALTAKEPFSVDLDGEVNILFAWFSSASEVKENEANIQLSLIREADTGEWSFSFQDQTQEARQSELDITNRMLGNE